MTRSLTFVLFSMVLALSPAWAETPCTDITTPAHKRVSYQTPGYEPVVVVVKMLVPDGKDVVGEARKGFMRFWIAGRDPTIRLDADRDIDSIQTCSFVFRQGTTEARTDKIYIRLRMLVVDEWNTARSFVLRSGIYLPKSLIAKRPRVETELDSGTVLRGTWDRVTMTLSTPFPLRIRNGKRHVAARERTISVARLTLQP